MAVRVTWLSLLCYCSRRDHVMVKYLQRAVALAVCADIQISSVCAIGR